MRTTRLAAAGAAAAIALSGTVAAANTTDDQTVTITVTALARSVTTAGAATFTITAGAAGSTSVMGGEPTIAYTNGAGSAAKITATLTAVNDAFDAGDLSGEFNDFGDLELNISLAAAAADRTESASTGSAIKRTGSDMFLTTGDLLNNIPTNVARSATAVAYTLGGTAPSTAGVTELTITFMIADN